MYDTLQAVEMLARLINLDKINRVVIIRESENNYYYLTFLLVKLLAASCVIYERYMISKFIVFVVCIVIGFLSYVR